MKITKIFRILAIASIVSLLVTALPATPVLAVSGLQTVPISAKIGEDIDVFGFGFTSTFNIYLYFSNEAFTTGDRINTDVKDYKYLGAVTADAFGEIDRSVEIPATLANGENPTEKVHSGTYYIYATYSTSTQILAVTTFVVEATGAISLDTTSGTVGTAVKITGQDYGSSEAITVTYNGTTLNIESGATASDSGGGFVSNILVPLSATGGHAITVTGASSGAAATATFTVGPTMTSSPASGTAGTSITVAGTGFGDAATVTVIFDTKTVVQPAADQKGSFSASFGAPSLPDGTYVVEADDGTNSLESNFTITATTFTTSPVKGNKDTTVTVTGGGFLPGKPITVTFDVTPSSNLTVATTTSDSNGGFVANFVTPVPTVGTYRIRASDGTNAKQANFSVEAIVTSAISPQTSPTSPGHIGSEITVSGSGYTPNGLVTVEYDDSQITTTPVTAEGTFSATFEAPPGPSGQYAIRVSDNTTEGNFAFTMESTPPATPAQLAPEMGIKAEPETVFDWADVTDDSLPVSYSLQLATSPDFSSSSMVLEQTGLDLSEYTISAEDRLQSVSEEAPYHWRVRATDGAGNESPWSGTGTFHIGTGFSFSQAWIYVLMSIGALLLAVFAFWMGRKTAYY